MPRCNFSRGRHDAAPRFFKRPARCRAAIFQEAGAIPRLSSCNFSRGRRDTTIAALQFLFGRHDTTIAAPKFFLAGAILRLPRRNFYWPVRYYDCRAVIFEVAGVILRLPCRNFSLGRRDRMIAPPQFFQLAGAIPKLPFDCCFPVLRPFAAIWCNPQAMHQPFGAILIAPTIRRNTQPRTSHLLIQSIVPPSGAKLKHLAPIGHQSKALRRRRVLIFSIKPPSGPNFKHWAAIRP